MGLSAEIRELIYDALLVDPISEKSRRVCTVDALGNHRWFRITGRWPPVDEPMADGP
jgi:hypothetical protein